LLKTDQSSTNFWRSNLGVVHWDDHGQSSNTHTSDETTTKDGAMSRGSNSGGLNDDTNDENSCADKNGVLAGECLGDETTVH